MPILEAVKWGESRKQFFAEWIRQELVNTEGDRAALDRKWADEIVQWRAALPKTEKEFPWPGASNLVFPLTAMHSDPVYADFMQTLHAPQEYWSVAANRPDRVHYAGALTEFAMRVEQRFLKMRTVNSRALMDNNLLGTAIYKDHWLHERKKVRDYVGDGPSRKVGVRTKIRSQPLIETVPLQHFWIPADAWDIDPDAPIGGARWVGQELYYTRQQLVQRAESETPLLPAFSRDAVAMVLAFEHERENTVDGAIRQQEQFSPWNERRIRIFEIHARFDVDGDDIEEDVVVMIHRESGEVLRALYNPFLHGKRPFHRTRYLPTFGFYGIGLGEMDRWAQITATKLINGIIDNVMIANTRMFQAPRGSGIQPGEPIYPGKIWLVGPDEEVKVLPMGEVYPSIFNTLGSLIQYADQRVAVPELRQGDISDLPDRTPAASLLSTLREGSKRFDMILADFREVHGRMGLQTYQLLAERYQEDPARWRRFCEQALGPEDAEKVIEVLSASVHNLEDDWGVSVTATSAQVNKEADKQQFIGLLQILGDVYPKLVQTATLLQQLPPGTPAYETASAAYTSGVQLIGELLEKFGIQNPREYIGQLDAVAAQLSAQGAGGAPPMAPPSPTPMPPGMPAMPTGLPIGPDNLAALLGVQ